MTCSSRGMVHLPRAGLSAASPHQTVPVPVVRMFSWFVRIGFCPRWIRFRTDGNGAAKFDLWRSFHGVTLVSSGSKPFCPRATRAEVLGQGLIWYQPEITRGLSGGQKMSPDRHLVKVTLVIIEKGKALMRRAHSQNWNCRSRPADQPAKLSPQK